MADLHGKSVLITAGPTQEPIDPVRYLSNHSSGKMGFALARQARDWGARVTLVTGPVALEDPEDVEVVHVITARDMFDVVERRFPEMDLAIFAAAVADYRPLYPSDHKLKKGRDDKAMTSIVLVENPDILAHAGAAKRDDQVVVGFAAETNDVMANGRQKLAKKHADMIVANEVGEGKAFGTDDDQVTLIFADSERRLPLMKKSEVAAHILDAAASLRF